MSEHVFYALLFASIGAFSFCAAYFNWDFFFNSYRMRWVISIFGREDTRTIYRVIGIGFFSFGIFMLIAILLGF